MSTMTDYPTIAVIIPAYNQAQHITASLDSVAAQTYPGDLEVIVIDDESPDDTGQRALEHHLKPKVVRQTNTGVSGARNRGIAESDAQWLAFLDADDLWDKDKLLRQYQHVAKLDRPCLSFTRYKRFHDSGAETLAAEHPSKSLEPSPRQLMFQNFIGTSTVMVHRDCLSRCGHFPSNDQLLKAGQDYALWLRIASLFPLVYVTEVLTHYRIHDVNRVGTDPLKHYQGGINALKSFQRWSPDRFEPLAGATMEHIIAVRTSKLLKDVVLRHREYPNGTLRRSLPTIARQLFF